MNCVDYASDQFGENLQFNSETLTNVLYDNIYKILGDNFEEEKFIEWLVDELLKNGCIVKVPQQQQDQKKEEPKEEIVYELDDTAYQNLKEKVGEVIELLKS